MNIHFLTYFLVLFPFFLSAQTNSKLTERLQLQMSGSNQIEAIVILKKRADLSQTKGLQSKEEKAEYVYSQLLQNAEVSQESLKKWLIENEIEFEPIFIINALKLVAQKEQLIELALRTDVKNISHVPRLKELRMPRTTILHSREPEWGITHIGADAVWNLGFLGQGVVVGGQDTGYEWYHPALKSAYRGYISDNEVDHNYNWHDAIHEFNVMHEDTINPCGLNSDVPCDDHNHGTHTMGTMVGLDGENEIGLAPEAEWCGCRNMDRGYGTPWTYLECFQWFLAPTDLEGENANPLLAPHVIANSWSCPEAEGCDSTNWHFLDEAITNLKLSGCMVVVSAGNNGGDCESINRPASMFENSFAVGACNPQDSIASFSSRGPVTVDGSGRVKPDVVAPGVQVRSCIRNGEYDSWAGTSMAGPHVAGVVALMISANPQLAGQVDTIEKIIQETSVQLYTDQWCGGLNWQDVPNNTYGYGRIDAHAAVLRALDFSFVGTETKAEQNFKLFPNPVVDKIELVFNDEGIRELSIVNSEGKVLSNYKVQFSEMNLDLDISLLNSGFYLLRIETEESIESYKFFKL